jgi:hypothetical protein
MSGFGSGSEPALGGAAISGQIVTAVVDRAERKQRRRYGLWRLPFQTGQAPERVPASSRGRSASFKFIN